MQKGRNHLVKLVRGCVRVNDRVSARAQVLPFSRCSRCSSLTVLARCHVRLECQNWQKTVQRLGNTGRRVHIFMCSSSVCSTRRQRHPEEERSGTQQQCAKKSHPIYQSSGGILRNSRNLLQSAAREQRCSPRPDRHY